MEIKRLDMNSENMKCDLVISDHTIAEKIQHLTQPWLSCQNKYGI